MLSGITRATTAGGGGGGVTGSGSTGKLAKFTGASAVGDSIASETGTVLTVANIVNAVTGYQVNGVALGISNIGGLGTGVATFLATPSSANLAAAVTNETGSGALVFATSPALVTPDIGTPSAATLTNATGLPVSTGISGLAAGVAAFLATPSSANLATAVTDETGSGALVFANTPTLVTPVLGVATATSVNKVAITAPGTSATLTIANGKTLTVSNTLTFTGTDSSSVAFGAGGTVAYVANNLSVFAATTSAQLAGVISDETGSGALVFATSPTLVTPVLGAATATTLAIGGTVLSELTCVSTSSATPRGIASMEFSADTSSARFGGYKARGTQASPTTIVTADIISNWAGWAHDGSNFLETASIRMVSEGTIAATRTPSYMSFLTSTDAAPSVMTEVLRMNSAQNIGIGTGATITAAVHITRNGALSSGNGPAMKLDGTWITGGTTTTTKPYVLIEPAGTTSANWSASGTGIGVNAASGFIGSLLDLQLSGTSNFKVSSAGAVTSLSSITCTSLVVNTNGIGTSVANITLNFAAGNFSTASRFAVTLGAGTHSQTSGTNGALTITPTYNQSASTAANTDLLINRTQTSLGSGAQLLIDLQVGAASKFSVSNTGECNQAETRTIAGTVADGLAASIIHAPTYTAATAQTVTRHNYMKFVQPVLTGAGPAALTDACFAWFDAAAGTHKAVDSSSTKVTVGAVDAWVKINVNGSVMFMPAYTSKTA